MKTQIRDGKEDEASEKGKPAGAGGEAKAAAATDAMKQRQSELLKQAQNLGLRVRHRRRSARTETLFWQRGTGVAPDRVVTVPIDSCRRLSRHPSLPVFPRCGPLHPKGLQPPSQCGRLLLRFELRRPRLEEPLLVCSTERAPSTK